MLVFRIWWQLVSQVFRWWFEFRIWVYFPFRGLPLLEDIRNYKLNAEHFLKNLRQTIKALLYFVASFFLFFRPQMLLLQLSCPMQYLTRTTQNVLKISIQGPYFKRRRSSPKMTARMSLGPKQTSADFVTRCTPALPPYARTCALTQEKSHISVTFVWSHSLRMPI